jgi:hypothetical protein
MLQQEMACQIGRPTPSIESDEQQRCQEIDWEEFPAKAQRRKEQAKGNSGAGPESLSLRLCAFA